MRSDGSGQHLVVRGVAGQVHGWAASDGHQVANVVQVVSAKRNGESCAHLEVADAMDFIRPSHDDLLGRHAQTLQFLGRFGGCQIRPHASSRAIPGQGLRIEVVSVAVRDRVQVDRRQIRRSQWRRHQAIEVESVRLPDRLAGIGEIGVDRDDFPGGTLEDEARLAQPPERDRACRHLVAAELISSYVHHRLTSLKMWSF